jgi:hypothetical protein
MKIRIEIPVISPEKSVPVITANSVAILEDISHASDGIFEVDRFLMTVIGRISIPRGY